jgi:glycosyltransferase involved in cell wall biosynthesis
MTNRKTVIFVQGNLYPYNIGGHEVFNYYLFAELSRQYDVKVISNYKRPEIIPVNSYLKISNLKPHSISFPLLTFFKLLRFPGAKVILTFSKSHWINWWPYPILKKLIGLDYIIIIHGGGLTKWKWKFPYLKLFQNASTIIGISERICKEYEFRTGLKIRKLLPLIHFLKYEGNKSVIYAKYNIDPDTFIILTVGSIKQIKNPNTIVDAAILLGTDFLKKNRIKFVFAGDGNLRADLELKVKKLNLDNYITFLGNVNRESVPELYSIASGYIISSDFEGTPLSLVEAMNNEIPVIGSDAPGINIIIKNNYNGLLFETRNAHNLADKIKLLMIEGAKFTGNAIKTINSSFNHEEMMREYKKIIDN